MPIVRRTDCVPLPIVVCPVVAVVMLESRVARCVPLCGECCGWRAVCHCVENVACLRQPTFSTQWHTARHPTLQHHNSYNRTDNYRQWNAVGSPDDGHNDARNMLRYYWLPINHFVASSWFLLYLLIKMHGHSNIKVLLCPGPLFLRPTTGYRGGKATGSWSCSLTSV